MNPPDAFDLGWRSADSGFFFDAMEILAALSAEVGGFDVLRGPLELVFLEKDQVHEHGLWLARTTSAAFRTDVAPPTTVDAYRDLLTSLVFEIVNRWSYIADIKQVTRLQAWFYAGFGLGRGATVLRGIRLYQRMREVAPASPALADMPLRLQRMAAEAAKQMDVASEEDDLRAVRPLFEAVSLRLKARSIGLQQEDLRELPEAELAEDLTLFSETARRVQMDFVRP